MRIELSKNLNSINNNLNSSNILFKSNNVLVSHNYDYFKFNNINGDTYIIIGKICGIYNEIDFIKIHDENQLKNLLPNYNFEEINDLASISYLSLAGWY